MIVGLLPHQPGFLLLPGADSGWTLVRMEIGELVIQQLQIYHIYRRYRVNACVFSGCSVRGGFPGSGQK